MQQWLIVAGVAASLCLSSNNATAQNNGGGAAGRGRARGNFDPAQMRERMMERYKETLEINSDDEWKAVEPLVQNVMQARMDMMRGGMGRGMFGARRGGNRGGDQGAQPQQQQRRFGPPPSPEAEALQRAIDSKAPKAELKAAISKYVEARKANQEKLDKAQDELRKVLTPRQEAIATLDGLL